MFHFGVFYNIVMSVIKIVKKKLFFLIEIVRRLNIVINMDNKVRNVDLIEKEYNTGSWLNFNSYFDSIKTAPFTVEDILFPKNSTNYKVNTDIPKLRVTESLVVLDETQYLKFKSMKLASIFSSKDSNILELGSGYGWNLISLRYHGFTGKLYGIDISPNAVQLCNKISDYLKLSIKAQVLDIKYVKKDSIDTSLFDIVLVYQVLEQLPEDIEAILYNIVHSFPNKKFFLIESASELFPKSLSDILTRVYVKKQNYQNTVLKYLRKLENEGLIFNFGFQRYRCSSKFGHENIIIRFDT